jgi:xanthine dehydrogenase YagS FAD-binding subunit
MRQFHRENALAAGEILAAIVLPAPPQTVRWIHLRFAELCSLDWPIADVAVLLGVVQGVCRQAAVVLDAAAPVPHRAIAAEVQLLGRVIDELLARRAAHATPKGAAPLSQNGYKLPISETLVRRAILATAGA